MDLIAQGDKKLTGGNQFSHARFPEGQLEKL